jgi:hypothetical protein
MLSPNYGGGLSDVECVECANIFFDSRHHAKMDTWIGLIN